MTSRIFLFECVKPNGESYKTPRFLWAGGQVLAYASKDDAWEAIDLGFFDKHVKGRIVLRGVDIVDCDAEV